jgi:hypothetical protein
VGVAVGTTPACRHRSAWPAGQAWRTTFSQASSLSRYIRNPTAAPESGRAVRDDEARVDLAAKDALQERPHAALDVALSGLDGERTIHDRAHRVAVRKPPYTPATETVPPFRHAGWRRAGRLGRSVSSMTACLMRAAVTSVEEPSCHASMRDRSGAASSTAVRGDHAWEGARDVSDDSQHPAAVRDGPSRAPGSRAAPVWATSPSAGVFAWPHGYASP